MEISLKSNFEKLTNALSYASPNTNLSAIKKKSRSRIDILDCSHTAAAIVGAMG